MTYWLLLDVVESVWGGVDDLTLDLVCPTTVVSQATSGHGNIDVGHGESLAVVERLDGGESRSVLLEEVGELAEQLATVLWSHLSPATIESLAGGGHSNVDILLRGFLNRADDLLVRWVDGFKGLVVDTLNPLAVDETGLWSALEGLPRELRLTTYSPTGCSYLPVEGVSSVIVRSDMISDVWW